MVLALNDISARNGWRRNSNVRTMNWNAGPRANGGTFQREPGVGRGNIRTPEGRSGCGRRTAAIQRSAGHAAGLRSAIDAGLPLPFANRFFRERFGMPNGNGCYEFLFDRNEPCENCETFKVLDSNVPQEWFWTGPDGRDYHIFDYPFTDADGSSLIMEMGIDITEQKKAEEGLQASSRYARGLLEASLDPLVTISPEGQITDVNRATELVTGVTAKRSSAATFPTTSPSRRRPTRAIGKVLSEGLVNDYPLTIRHVAGRHDRRALQCHGLSQRGRRGAGRVRRGARHHRAQAGRR